MQQNDLVQKSAQNLKKEGGGKTNAITLLILGRFTPVFVCIKK